MSDRLCIHCFLLSFHLDLSQLGIQSIKDTLWVLRRDEPLVHVSVDISLITKHILDHDISLKS